MVAALRLGSTFGAHTDCVDSIMAEDGIDPATEQETALETSRDLFATLFLLNSDKRHFVPLIRDIVNEFKCDRDTYPRTLTSACGDYIARQLSR